MRKGTSEEAVTAIPQPPRRARGATLWVTAREAFWIALEALRSHKLRSFQIGRAHV